jgi:hypothetical protein
MTCSCCMRRIAYEDRQGHFVFIKVPGEYGRYVRTSVSVSIASCAHCGSDIGEPCKGQYGRYVGVIHVDRANKATRILRDLGITRTDLIVEDEREPTALEFWRE